MKNISNNELIKETIESVEGEYTIDRLIQDCADKLSLPIDAVKDVVAQFNMEQY